MARPKKVKPQDETKLTPPASVPDVVGVPEVPATPSVPSVSVADYGNNVDYQKADDLAKEPSGTFCKFCRREHKKTFDAPGINHEPFSPGGKAEIMFNSLCEQPKRPIFIPFEIGERRGAIKSPQLNGLRINILKGTYVEVPQQVAELIMESMQQTAAAEDNLMTFNREAGEYRSAKLDLRSDTHRKALDA